MKYKSFIDRTKDADESLERTDIAEHVKVHEVKGRF